MRTLEPFWPGGSHGSIIITTRNPVAARYFGQQAIEVPLFTRLESEDFMLDLNPSSDRSNKSESNAVQTITNRLGYLPLVLNGIGSYTCNIASSYQVFLQHYSDFDSNLLFQNVDTGTAAYQRTVSATWTMNLVRIDPAAKTLMEDLVFFDPGSIPLTLFEACDVDEM